MNVTVGCTWAIAEPRELPSGAVSLLGQPCGQRPTSKVRTATGYEVDLCATHAEVQQALTDAARSATS